MADGTLGEARAVEELVHELRRQEENCNYTAASLYSWVKFLRFVKAVALVCQVIFGALATWKVLVKDYQTVTAVFALLAAVIAPLLSAIKISDEIDLAKKAAIEFTALRDRFRRAALVESNAAFPTFKAEAEVLFDRMDKARQLGTAAPDFFFWLAQRKIKSGHYTHDYDEQRQAG